MTKIDDLLRTLDALSNANRSGYKCNSEMDSVISALLDELNTPVKESLATTIADYYPITEEDAQALLTAIQAQDAGLRAAIDRCKKYPPHAFALSDIGHQQPPEVIEVPNGHTLKVIVTAPDGSSEEIAWAYAQEARIYFGGERE